MKKMGFLIFFLALKWCTSSALGKLVEGDTKELFCEDIKVPSGKSCFAYKNLKDKEKEMPSFCSIISLTKNEKEYYICKQRNACCYVMYYAGLNYRSKEICVPLYLAKFDTYLETQAEYALHRINGNWNDKILSVTCSKDYLKLISLTIFFLFLV